MKRESITIGNNGVITMPTTTILMTDFEIAASVRVLCLWAEHPGVTPRASTAPHTAANRDRLVRAN